MNATSSPNRNLITFLKTVFQSWVSWRIALTIFLMVFMVFFAMTWAEYEIRSAALYDSLAGYSPAKSENPINNVEIDLIKGLIAAIFITLFSMIIVGRWLLEPVLFMRNNLLAASNNPENPEILSSPFGDKGEIGSAIAIAQNLIEQNAGNIRQVKRTAEDKIHKLAYFDPLTTLPNRTFFVQEVNQTIKNQRSDKTREFFVVAVDLDNFKDINDSMGHNVGDAILRSVGKKLRSLLPVDAIVSRTGEDEFAILVFKSEEITSPSGLAKMIIDEIRSEPFKVFSEELQVRSSIGVVAYPQHGENTEDLLKNVDIALNRAKEEGRNVFKEYSEDFDRAVQARFQMVRDLRDALEYEQLSLYYQPQLDLKTGQIIGAEALIRWWRPNNSKEGGFFVSPGEFIPVAEQSGLIGPIGEWVIARACRDAKKWITEYNLNMRVAVNVSAVQFMQGDLKRFVINTLEDANLESRYLELEVTETLFMEDVAHTIQTLKSLSELGIELAIDDFGTGYSSLAYLRQFPIDRLKIDQSFIRNALNDPNDASIAKTIVALGRSLNLKVIAEGVETREHENFLIREGCDEVQGFRYSKPLPFDEFITFCQNYDGHLDSFSRLS